MKDFQVPDNRGGNLCSWPLGMTPPTDPGLNTPFWDCWGSSPWLYSLLLYSPPCITWPIWGCSIRYGLTLCVHISIMKHYMIHSSNLHGLQGWGIFLSTSKGQCTFCWVHDKIEKRPGKHGAMLLAAWRYWVINILLCTWYVKWGNPQIEWWPERPNVLSLYFTMVPPKFPVTCPSNSNSWSKK